MQRTPNTHSKSIVDNVSFEDPSEWSAQENNRQTYAQIQIENWGI